MSLPPPPGYAIALVSFQKAGTPHLMATTCALRNNTGLTAAAVNAAWRTAMLGTSARPFHTANLITGYSVVETYVLNCDAGGGLTAHSDTTVTAGARAVVGMPVNTSVVVRKTVAVVGRQYRGRMLFPPTYVASSAVDSDGVIAGASLVNIQGFVNNAWANLNTANLTPVLLHQPPQGGGGTPAPTLTSGFVVNARIGTIRHRIRR